MLVAPLVGLLAVAWPIRPSHRTATVLAVLAGAVGTIESNSSSAACLGTPGSDVVIEGWFLARSRGASTPLQRTDGCGVQSTVWTGRGESPPVGTLVRVHGEWRSGRTTPWLAAGRVEEIVLRPHDHGRGVVGPIRRMVVRWRSRRVDHVYDLFGERAPLVAALVVARREGLDPRLRDGFAAAGIAHLLAISGFHVGLLAGLMHALLRGAGVPPRRAALGAALGAWGYVLLIGIPAAAARAAAMLSFAAASRARGRQGSRWGAVAAAGLVLLAGDPSRVRQVGFQLSFAGVAGLVAWAGAWRRSLSRYLPAWMASPIAAGAAATLSTLPIAAWHFGRVSLIGLPATWIATPLVAVALPGALLALLADLLHPRAGAFLAGGVDLFLFALERLAVVAAELPGATTWISQPTVIAGAIGVVGARWVSTHPGIGRGARRSLTVAYVTTAVLAWPALLHWSGRDTLELWMIDVGQGDAVALRSPRGRWILVDAGRPPRGADGRGHPVVRALRSRGVQRLDALVLTHADADHTGGASEVLRNFEVSRVFDPGYAAPKKEYRDLLRSAVGARVPWSIARAGTTIPFDGVEISVLYPTPDDVKASAEASEANATSLVLLVEWRGFRALLTGDAYVDVERRLAPSVGDIDLLKVGHHGSNTSTDAAALEVLRPEWAWISVGRGNRYGHPTPEVLIRLKRAGVHVLRTDEAGDVRAIVRGDGGVTFPTSLRR